LVTVPTLGDSVQTLKAGIMEIGDIFIVNKADRGDAERTAMEIKAMLGLAPQHSGWRPPVLLAAATEGRGIAQILKAVDEHRHYLVEHGLLINRRKVRRRQEILEVVEDRLLARVGGDRVDALATRVAEGGLDPYTAADELLGRPGIR